MVAVEAAGADAPRMERLTYSGRRGPLYRIFLTNLGLSIVTLSVYRFWGRTRIRRYLWGRMEFQGDRFEWTGSGGEMFIAFLIAGAVLLALTVVSNILQVVALATGSPVLLAVLQTAYVIVIGLLVYVAMFWALRYRLSRTRWRGIRGVLSGSGWAYALRAVGWELLSLVTLLLAKPFADVVLARYRIDRISIGDATARCTPRARAVYRRYIPAWTAAWLVIAATIGFFIALFSYGLATATPTGTSTTDETGSKLDIEIDIVQPGTVVMLLGAVAIVQLIWIVCFVSYKAALVRHIASTTEVAGLRFALTFRTRQLLRLAIGNFFISVFTLGLGLPIVLDRKARFLARHLEVQGTLDGAAIGQSSDRGPRRGEGLVDLLDLGAV